MVAFFKSWCESIIVAVIISIIIEAILPDGNNKKYVKVVIGVYIIFTILNPLLSEFNLDFDFSNEISAATKNSSTVSNDDIKAVYANGLEETLKKNIEEKFKIKVNFLKITYDEKYENIDKINISVQSGNIPKIKKVEIGNKTEEIEENNNYEEIKKYVSENYNVDLSQIYIE